MTQAPAADPPPEENAAAAPVRYLHPGGPTVVEGRVDGPGEHRYALKLAASDYLQAVAEQEGADVLVTLVDPAGRVLVEMDSPTAGWGPERIAAVATETGVHHLEVRPWSDDAAGGYLLRIESRKPAGPADRSTARGYQRFQEGLTQVGQGHHPLARRSFTAAAEEWAEARHTYGEALASFEIAGTWRRQGRVDRALAAYATALPKLEAAGLTAHAGEARYLAADLHLQAERHAEALGHYRDALAHFRSLGNRPAQAGLLNQIGLAHRSLGQPRQALAAYAAAAELWRELGQREKLAQSLHNRVKVLLELGDYDTALADLDRALELYREAGEEMGRAEVLVALGQVHQRRSLAPVAGTRRRDRAARDHGLERALELYGEALAVLRAHGAEEPVIGAVLLESGKCKAELGATADALADLHRAEAIFRREGPVRSLGLTEMELGALALHRDDLPEAGRYFHRALGRFEDIGDPTERVPALGWLAITRRRAGDLAGASELLSEAVTLLEELRRTPGGFDRRSTFLASRQNFYEVYIDVLMERHAADPSAGHDRRALEIHERSRARALLEHVDGGGGKGDDTVLPAPLDAGELQRSVLDPGTLLAAYHLGPARSVLWLLSADRLDTFILPPREEIESLAVEGHALLSSPPVRRSAHRLASLRAELGRILLEPAAERLQEAGAERLVVVPSGALVYLPFAALPDPGTGEPVVKRLEVVQLPSASLVAALRRLTRQREPARRLLAVVYDPVFSSTDPRLSGGGGGPAATLRGPSYARLEHSQREASVLHQLVPGPRRLSAGGFAATRELLAGGELADTRILHLATHGVLAGDQPRLIFSRLDARGRPRRGALSGREIAGLDLSADLVVLSACRSGLGTELRGEGLVGLPHAFLRAGATRLVVSMWSVEDEATAVLMEAFYRALFAGHGPAAALRRAQLALLAEPAWREPYYWAPFILQGDWRPFDVGATYGDAPADSG